MVRAIALILSGNLGSAALMMVRTLLVSRLVSLEDFGIASTFLLTLALIEMVSALGLQHQMIQAKDGDAVGFQAALQGFSVLRGVFNACAIFVLAWPMTWLFAIPQLLWAFQLIALVPFVAGFLHFDHHRHSRQMKFRPGVLVALIPPSGSLLAVWPLYHLVGDFRVMLFAMLLQMALTVVVSHLVAERRYRIEFDRAVMRRCLSFGWPVMVGGTLMFLVFNGERAIIGAHMGLEVLALFSMALSLTLTPALVISRTTMSLFLPQLSSSRGQPGHDGLIMASLQAHLLMGGVLAVTVTIFGGPFLLAVLGAKYAAAVPLLAWLGILQAFRVFEAGCAVVALSAARTGNEMWANIVRVALLPLAWFWVAQGGDIISVIWIGIAGEAAGFAVGLTLAKRQQNFILTPLILPMLLVFGALGLCAWSVWAVPDWRIGAAMIAALGAAGLPMADLRRHFNGSDHSGQVAKCADA